MNGRRIVRRGYNYRLAASNLNASPGIAVVTVLQNSCTRGERYKIQNLRGLEMKLDGVAYGRKPTDATNGQLLWNSRNKDLRSNNDKKD